MKGSPDGITRRAILEEAAKAGRYTSELQNPLEFPEGLEYLWNWFLEITSVGRTYIEGALALPISSTELHAWCQLNGVELAPWELRALRGLDVAWLNIRNRR